MDQVVPDINIGEKLQPTAKPKPVETQAPPHVLSTIERFLLTCDREEHVGEVVKDSPVVPNQHVTSIPANNARPAKRKMGIPPIRRLSEDARPLSHVELDIHRKIIQSHTSASAPNHQQPPAAATRVAVLPDNRLIAVNLANARTINRIRYGLANTQPSLTTPDVPSTPALFPATALAYPNTHGLSSVTSSARHDIPQTLNPSQNRYHPGFYRSESRRLITRSYSQPAGVSRSAAAPHTVIRPSASNPLVPASVLVNSSRTSSSVRSRDRSRTNANYNYHSDDT